MYQVIIIVFFVLHAIVVNLHAFALSSGNRYDFNIVSLECNICKCLMHAGVVSLDVFGNYNLDFRNCLFIIGCACNSCICLNLILNCYLYYDILKYWTPILLGEIKYEDHFCYYILMNWVVMLVHDT